MSNEDTVEQIVKCIIENEANAEALKQMLGDTEGVVSIVPSLCPHRESQDSGPPHHHTVHLGSTQAPCIHCTRKKRSLLHRMGRSKDGRGKPHPGEITVFSVGRFRVTHIGKKTSIQGSQDDSNISTEPMSSVKDQDELDGEKPQNGLSTHGDHKHESEDLPKNGPEEVGLTKLEKKKGSAIKSVAKNGLQRLNKKAPVTSVKKKGEKDRRSSAPEQTVAQRERIDITDVNAREQRKEKSPVAGDSQTKQVNTEDSAQGH
ncbi:RELT-like protein 2 [Bombina bombina]|uniref:RELT-like protein 2 n=1 Tax=Bombina bombina TaxID=8345 RepID=UPI00235AFB79|nr:RELT-like protein 2 [Bombina bombina]